MACEIKLEPVSSSCSSSNDNTSQRNRSHSSDSSKSSKSDWTDEETANKVSNAKPSEMKKKRSAAPRSFQSKKDYNRYDRPDMYINSIFPYMGLYLSPDLSRFPKHLRAFSLPNKKCKVLRLSVEGGVVATGAEIVGILQKSMLESKDYSDLPNDVSLKGQKLALRYAPPHGDELMFASHSQDSSWIGQNYLGTVLVSPARESQQPESDLSTVHDWNFEWTYRSWHRPRPSGILEPLPELPSLHTPHNRKKKIAITPTKIGSDG